MSNLTNIVLQKCPTGIDGFDEITGGGLPQGRTSLVCGSAGSGKTLFAVEFLVRGASEYGEPGVFLAFEETAEELRTNVASLGFDTEELIAKKLLAIDHVRVERSEIEETGEYDLEGLFIRVGYAIDSIGAKRVVLDTLETLFGGLDNDTILRSELRRLFRWLKDRGVTAVITGERGEGLLTRQGLEEYVSDCVILLDHRVHNQISTRRLRVVKYRGSSHGTNEYPFLIDNDGISVLPVTNLALNHGTSNERVSSGIQRLDAMLGGEGYFRGSSILISGTAGTGKSSIAAKFVEAACERGETCLYFAFEESKDQVVRNMRSIGIDLEPWISSGNLRFVATRPSTHGLEMHLAVMHKLVADTNPTVVVIDPISTFLTTGTPDEVRTMLTRLVDFLKSKGITALCTNLVTGANTDESTESNISSIMDTWLLLRGVESWGERNRVLYVLKSRGTAHSNQLREFVMSDDGIDLVDVYLGQEGFLAGSARLAYEARSARVSEERQQEIERLRIGHARKRKAIEAQIASLQAEIAAADLEFDTVANEEEQRKARWDNDQSKLAQKRYADSISEQSGVKS